MPKSKLLSRSALLVVPIALAVAGCQTATSDSGATQSDGALETAQSAKQDAMRNAGAITTLRNEIAALREEVMQSNAAAERAANAAERAAEEAKAAADKADRIFQRQMRKQ
jgi:hypothetical protein